MRHVRTSANNLDAMSVRRSPTLVVALVVISIAALAVVASRWNVDDPVARLAMGVGEIFIFRGARERRISRARGASNAKEVLRRWRRRCHPRRA